MDTFKLGAQSRDPRVAKFEKLETPLPSQGITLVQLRLQNVSKSGENFHIDVDHALAHRFKSMFKPFNVTTREINVFQMYRDDCGGSETLGNGINFHGGRSK